MVGSARISQNLVAALHLSKGKHQRELKCAQRVVQDV
jgi:hypothetical protein